MDSIIQNAPGIPGLSQSGLLDALLAVFVLSLRIGAFLIAAPFFGSRMVPLNIRIIAAMSVAIFLYGWVETPQLQTLKLAELVSIVFVEIVFGLTAGLIFSIAFSAAAIAGEKVAATSGLGFAMQVDPSTGTQSPVISQFFSLFLLVLFFSSDSHLIVFYHILQSYEIFPVGSVLDVNTLYFAIFSSSENMFETAVLIMIPIVGYLLLINLVVGIITRSAPQLNLFSFGFPITILCTIVILYFSVAPISNMLLTLIERHIDLLSDLIMEIGNG